MKNSLLKNALPHIAAIAIFYLVAIIYCSPALQGLILNQHDILGVKGMTQQSVEFYEKYGHYPLWTNALYSGMPAFQVFIAGKYNIGLGWLHHLFTGFLPYPAGLFFLSSLSFYILSRVLKIKPWIGILGGLAYALASYNAIIIAVGHISKFAALAYAPAVLAGIILVMQRKYFTGFALTLLFTTLFFVQNHVQAAYYFFILFGCLFVAFLVKCIQEKQIKHLLVSTGLLAIAFAISAFSFAVILLPSMEYTKETMRGGRSELTHKDSVKGNQTKGGLDKDYAFLWSMGKSELMTFALPNFYGSSSNPGELGEDGKLIEAFQQSGLPQEAANYFYGRMSPYWGDQPNTSGPVYFGAIICMLFIAGLIFVPRKYLWWIIPATIFTAILAVGSNLKGINYFLFDYMPFLKKFRAPSQALIVPQLTFSLVAILALQQIFYGNIERSEFLKKLKYSAIAWGAVLLIYIGVFFTASFKNQKDADNKKAITEQLSGMMAQGSTPDAAMTSQASGIATSLINGLAADRKTMYGSDLLRLLIISLLAAVIIWLVTSKKLKPLAGVILLAAITLYDVINVDMRYLNKENYVTEEDFLAPYNATAADMQIKTDTSYYRVVDQTAGNPFDGNARASYHHNSVGGYSAVKMGLYQDLVDRQLSQGNMKVFNMLNAKYFITVDPSSNQAVPQLNSGAYGPVWFVKNVRFVKNADEEMDALTTLNSRDSAVADQREQTKVTVQPVYDSTATIALVKNMNDEILYTSNAATNQFAVFSEIYYPYGWKAYIDGKETPIVKVNYLLRGLNVPAGKHDIRFEFKPESYEKGNTLMLVGGIISLLVIAAWLGWLGYGFYKKQKLT